MKYLIFNNQLPVIFPDDIHHIQIANGLREYKPTSAGHMSIFVVNADNDVQVETYEKAETIGMEPGEDDEDILTEFLNE